MKTRRVCVSRSLNHLDAGMQAPAAGDGCVVRRVTPRPMCGAVTHDR